jgi:hypothetical protein
MEYPHWLMIAGAVLVVLGFVGLLVFRQREDAEAEIKETANGNEQGRSELEDEPVPTQETNRTAKLAEQARERWTRSERDKIRWAWAARQPEPAGFDFVDNQTPRHEVCFRKNFERAGIRSNDLYILTHPEVRDVVAGRFDQILDAFDKASLHEASTPPEAVSARP